MAKGKKTGGRTKGTPNKVTKDVVLLAREHGPMCIAALADLVLTGEPADQARAAGLLLDRGYGKPHQGISMHSTGSISVELVSFAGRQAVPVLSVPRGNGHTINGGPPDGHEGPSSE